MTYSSPLIIVSCTLITLTPSPPQMKVAGQRSPGTAALP